VAVGIGVAVGTGLGVGTGVAVARGVGVGLVVELPPPQPCSASQVVAESARMPTLRDFVSSNNLIFSLFYLQWIPILKLGSSKVLCLQKKSPS
jgi:hypothetical protein